MPGENETLAAAEEHYPPKFLLSPEPEIQRGRKRRRSPVPLGIFSTTKTVSGESATFRGRSRRRATSAVPLSGLSSAFASRNPSRTRPDGSASPSRKKLLRYASLVEQRHRRRSQSPSRSRSPNAPPGSEVSERQRRRQRTRSRSRDHGTTSFPAAGATVTSPASSLRAGETVVGDSEGSRDRHE